MTETEQPGRRQYPRQRVFSLCWVLWSTEHMSYRVKGMTVDVSRGGLAILLRHPAQLLWKEATIRVPKDLELWAQPVHRQPWVNRVKGARVGFKIRRIVSGEDQWAAMCNGSHPAPPQGVGPAND